MNDLQNETIENLKAELRRLQDAYEHKRGFAARQADYGDWEPTNELIDISAGITAIKAELARRVG